MLVALQAAPSLSDYLTLPLWWESSMCKLTGKNSFYGFKWLGKI